MLTLPPSLPPSFSLSFYPFLFLHCCPQICLSPLCCHYPFKNFLPLCGHCYFNTFVHPTLPLPCQCSSSSFPPILLLLRLHIVSIVAPHCTRFRCHNLWSVFVIIYNLSYWLCMKRKYKMWSMMISGPRQPGNDIDVYLSPLIEDLKFLWD